jgi:Ca-activated chloride channel family protein
VSFISPLNFLFAGLLGAILLLYMLRLKRKERIVASNLLWDSAIRDLQANAPWQKLRSSLLMWLQLAFLALTIFALARPAIKVLAAGGQTVAIVVDGSASMGATDVAPSRFERARAEALRLVNGLASGDAGTVILASRQTRVLAPLSNDKNTLKRALTSAKNYDTGSDLRESIVLAASLLKDKKNPQIYVLSDGAAPSMSGLQLGKIGLQFVKIGKSGDNLAITALDARRGYGQQAKSQIFATVANYGSAAKTVNLELSRDGALIEVRPITIPAAKKDASGETIVGQASELFDDIKFDSGQFAARFQSNDALEADNIAYANLSAPREINVCLAADNLFLEKALNIDATTRVYVGAPPAGRDFDVVVLDGSVPANLPNTNQLVFNAQTPLCPIEKIGEIDAPSVADYDRNHPVTRYAPWNELKFAKGWAVKTLAWGQPVVEGERSPLIVAGEKNGRRVVWCGFDLRDSDLALRVAFPIFITNALRWLSAPSGSSNLEGVPFRTGEAIPLLAPQEAKEISVTAPDGSKLMVRPRENGAPILFDGANQVGAYTAQSGKWKQAFAVSLLSKSESDIAPRNSLKLSEQQSIGAENKARSNRELWGFLIVFALLLLAIEWWVFHRGV